MQNIIKLQKHITIYNILSILLLMVISLGIIFPINTRVDNSEAAIGDAVLASPSLTLTSASSSASVDLVVNDTAGTFASSTTSGAPVSFNVSTNNYKGYELSIVDTSSTNAGKLVNSSNNETLSSISSSTTITNPSNPTGFSNGEWGYIPSTYYENNTATDNNTTKYFTSPTTTATTLDKVTSANSSANGKDYTIGLGVKADYTKPSGTYSRTFNIIAVSNPTPYTVTYTDNSGDSSVSGLPTTQASDGDISSINFTLNPPTPTRTNYNLIGWCLGTVSNNGTTCTGTTYHAGDTFGIDQTVNNTNITLYALWELAGYTITFNLGSNVTGIVFNGTTYANGQNAFVTPGTYTINGTFNKCLFGSWSATAGIIASTSTQLTTYTVTANATLTLNAGTCTSTAMQSLSSSSCTTTAKLVYDTRDNEVYWVQKLVDGKCWMLDNLALDLTTVSLESLKGNTNAEDDTLTYLKNGGGTGQYANSAVADWTSSNSYTAPLIGKANASNPTAWTKDTVPANSKYNNNGGSYKIGYYYNYCAASAGSYCYASGAGVDTANTLVDAAEDICPAGWHMPTSDVTQDSDYGKLCWLIKGEACTSSTSDNPMNNSASTSLQYALSTPLSGYFYSGTANSQGSYGNFWSSTRYSTLSMRTLYVTATGVIPQNSNGRNYGSSVRCVLNPPKLYDAVAEQSKGNFDMSTINTELTTANSGVYKYTGTHSDDNPDGTDGTKDIYFYRGILDNSFTNSNSYGSSGDGAFYPNYVKLSTTVGSTTTQTCWRIFRTTASGGVKMIYNGLWTGSTCANATTSANAVSSVYYNRPSAYASASSCPSSNAHCGTLGFITYVGYNYNSTYAYNNTSYTSAIANSTLFNNGTASNIRSQVESWYTSTIGTSYSSLFETNAGYCNDRTTYNRSNTIQTSTIPYATSSATVYFGARYRLITNASPTLQCPNTTNLDLLNGTTGKSYPVALITADEAALAGNGDSNKEAFSKTSYLTSGSVFSSLSPYYRNSSGYVSVLGVSSSGNLGLGYVYTADGVRPVVSLTSGTTIKSGSGTAADPWIVQ